MRPLPLALCTAAITAGLWVAFVQGVNHDAGWFLFLSDRVLAGERLYVDRIEINAPFIVWLGLPVAALGRLGIPTWYTWTFVVALLAAGSMALTGRLLARFDGVGSGVWAALAAALFFLPGSGFGQREHLALILLLPYIASTATRVARRPTSPWLAVTVGLGAALASSLKPHFVLIPVAVEAYAFVMTRRPGRESVAFLAGVVLCGLAVVLLAPEYVAVVREHAAQYARLTRQGWRTLLLGPGEVAVVLAIVLGLVRIPAADIRRVFGFAAAGGLACAVLQFKAWEYHYLPAYGAAFVALGVPVGEWRLARWARWLAVAGLLVMGYNAMANALNGERQADVRAATAGLERYRGEPVLLLPYSPRFSYPAALFAGVVPVLPYPDLWPARALYDGGAVPYVPLARAGTFERRVVERMVDASLATEPAAIFVQSDVPQDYLRFLSRDARFSALLACYEQRPDVAWFRVYERVCDARGETAEAGAEP